MEPVTRAVDATAGGAFLAVATGNGYLAGASLRAGAGAPATVTLRETNAGGQIIGLLGAAAGATDHFVPPAAVIYAGAVHVTIAGAGAELILYSL